MSDPAGVYPVTGLGNDPQFQAMRAALNQLIADVGRIRTFAFNRLATVAGTYSLTSLITDGSSSGKAKTTNTISYLIGGVEYTKAATDNLFDLTALTYDATLFTGVAFLLSAQGTGSITSATSTTAAKAVQSVLYKHTDTTKALVHCFVANAAATFGNSALTAQGSYNQNLTPDFSSYQVFWG